MPSYVDAFLFSVPKQNLPAYRRMAKLGARIWMEHGALGYYECMEDDVDVPGVLPFKSRLKPKPGEVMFFSFILYASKADRNRVNKKVMSDPRMAAPGKMPYDPKRMSFGGFKAFVEAGR